jgi:hypothetical protein
MAHQGAMRFNGLICQQMMTASFWHKSDVHWKNSHNLYTVQQQYIFFMSRIVACDKSIEFIVLFV